MLRRRWIVLAAWLTVLLVLAAWNALNLRLGADLSQFLPRGASQQDQVLLSQVRGGIAARTLLLRISGARPSGDLADASRALAAALRDEEGFFQIANGETTLDASATDAALFNHRYLIGPPRDCADALTEAGLLSALRERLGELASGMAMLDKQRLAADPTACYRQLLRALIPQRTPNRQHGVWFSPDGRHALLVVITAAQASDLAAQRLAIGRIQNTFASLPQSAGLSLELAGPGYFAISSEQQIKTETTLLSIAASIAVALILAFAFRSTSLVLLGMLPLLSGIMLGAAVVTLLFGFVHGITLALGITLLGVALDYPVHVYAHAADNPSQRASAVWHTLLLGMVTTVLGYAALAWTNFDGLSQLGIFAAVGLATAALTSRYLLPSLMPGDYRLPQLRSVAVLQSRLRPVSARVRLWLLLSSLALVGLLLLLHGDPWETDIRRLSVVPQAELDKDRLIRQQLGAPDVARLLYVLADHEADVLGRLNAALPDLQRIQADGLIDSFDNIARWLPSPGTQRLRQAMLPDRAELAAALERANADLPFRIDQLAPFLDDVERSRSLPPLRAEDLADSPIRRPRLDAAATTRWRLAWSGAAFRRCGRCSGECVASAGRAAWTDLPGFARRNRRAAVRILRGNVRQAAGHRRNHRRHAGARAAQSAAAAAGARTDRDCSHHHLWTGVAFAWRGESVPSRFAITGCRTGDRLQPVFESSSRRSCRSAADGVFGQCWRTVELRHVRNACAVPGPGARSGRLDGRYRHCVRLHIVFTVGRRRTRWLECIVTDRLVGLRNGAPCKSRPPRFVHTA